MRLYKTGWLDGGRGRQVGRPRGAGTNLKAGICTPCACIRKNNSFGRVADVGPTASQAVAKPHYS